MRKFAAMPASVDAVTAAWVEHAISSRFPEAGAVEARATTIAHGAATKLAFDVSYARPDCGLPTRVWVKGGWEAHSSMMIEMGCYAREAWFYESLAPTIAMPTPRCLYAAADPTGNGVVVMEDLVTRGARLWTCAVPASIGEVLRGVEALARLHARGNTAAVPDGILLSSTVTGPAATQWTSRFGEPYLAAEIAGERGAGMPEYARRPDLVLSSYHRMIAELAARPEVLVHGDCHPGNTFTDADGEVGFYDWQTVSRAPWAYDISYFVVSSLSVEDRRSAGEAILRHYLEAMGREGVVVPEWNEAWTDFRKYIAYGLYIWMSVPPEYQSREASNALTARFSAAAEDFDFFALWE